MKKIEVEKCNDRRKEMRLASNGDVDEEEEDNTLD